MPSCTRAPVVVRCVAVAQDPTPSQPFGRRRRLAGTRLPSRRLLHLLLLFVLALIVADGLVGDRGLLAMLRARRQHDALVADIARQRAENARLAEEARRLREDPSAIEEIARRDLGLARPGETVFIVKDVQPSESAPRH